MKKVLVTGATGFIGRHCLPLLLSRGYEVHAVSSKATDKKSPNIYWHQADLLEPEECLNLLAEVQPSHLLHLAWYVDTEKCWNSLENFKWVQASLQMLQLFARHGGERLVMAGTCAEYDWKYGYCSEKTTPLIPTTLYGTCKHCLQLLVDSFSKQTGLSSAWGRVFYLYGPHEHPKRLVSSVIRSLLQAEPALCTHGNQIRDYLYVQDAADAFVTLMESNLQGAINIASGNPVSLKEIVYKIADKFNRKDLVRLGAVPASTNEPRLIVADVGRLFNEEVWSPKHDLNAGIENTIDWWKKQ